MGLPSHQDHKARSNSAADYVRHRPETTLLYQIVQEYWPEFQAELASHGRYLPAYVTKEFDEYLKCGRLELRFRWVKAPTRDELTHLTHTIAHRVARYLERQGLLERDAEHAYLTANGVDEDPESPMNQLLGS